MSNFALIAGVAGGTANTRVISLAGVAGLAAGAFSMAGGEYVSVASQRELAQAEIDVERREMAVHPEEEQAELAALYERRGVDPDLAAEVARQISRNPEQALEVHTLNELGVKPGDLPSPVTAALSSFLSFSVGAVIPLVPYLAGVTHLWLSAGLSMAALFGAGAVVARLTARRWWFTGLRQLAVGAVAAGLTWGLGSLIGASGL